MLNIMKLEIEKLKIGGYVLKAFIANIIIIISFWFMVRITPAEDISSSMAGFCEILFPKIDFVVKATFIIFASVLIARLIIEEYRNKTISVLFMYPVNRKILMMSKLAIVVLFTFLTVLLSDIFVSSMLYVINTFDPVLKTDLTGNIAIEGFSNYLISALATSGIGLIPLYFGMRKKSVIATIISSILIVAIMRPNIGDFSMNSNGMAIVLALIGICIAFMSFRDIERKDVTN